jgi:hypothetical protein
VTVCCCGSSGDFGKDWSQQQTLSAMFASLEAELIPSSDLAIIIGVYRCNDTLAVAVHAWAQALIWCAPPTYATARLTQFLPSKKSSSGLPRMLELCSGCPKSWVCHSRARSLPGCWYTVCVCVCVCAVYRLTPGISGVVMAAGIAPGRTGSESLLRELAYTGRDFSSEEAARHGFVSRVFAERETMCEHALATAQQIAANSPCDCWPPAP